MDIFFWLKGFILGISIAAPVGPIGVLCIRRTLENGRLAGFVSGLGAATADGIYGLIAAAGLTFLTDFLVEQQSWMHYIGGIFLFYLGWKTYKSKSASVPAITDETNKKNLFFSYLSILLLTITNPVTILSFITIFAGAGIVSADKSNALLLVFGIIAGSACWWLLLSVLVSFWRQKIIPYLTIVNKISGVILLLFAVFILIYK